MAESGVWAIGSAGFAPLWRITLTLMRATVMMEGKPYYKVGGSIGRYPKFVPEDYVILRLNPRFQKGEWYSGCRRCLQDRRPNC